MKSRLIVLMALLAMLPITGMQKEPETCAVVSANRTNIFKSVQESIEKGKFIFVDAYVFTNENVFDSLKKAHEQGAHIEVQVGNFAQNRELLEKLQELGIQAQEVPGLHMKRILISEQNPRTGLPGKSTVFMGSSNLSYYAYKNFEAATSTQDATNYFMQQFRNHERIATQTTPPQSTQKLQVLDTPCGLQVFTSRSYKLGESKALRIDSLANSTNPHRLLYISSMNWNAPAVTQALINAYREGVDIKVIVNGSALRGGNEQLAQLHNAGVPVYVFDPRGEKREAQHSKLLLRFDGSDTLVINSTANLTPQGNRELNLDEYNPDPQVAEYFKEAFDDYIANHCIPYGEIELPASQPSQGTKRKLTFEKQPANKKPKR